jgi:2-oxoglutarate dehydrogenase complex dehydrogenase (E1) component-like enzyme
MDRFSFLNAAHSQLIEDLYQQYLKYPDSLEPSWKAFFQGFDFALENYGDDDNVQYVQALQFQHLLFSRQLRQQQTEKFRNTSKKNSR